MTEYPDKEEQYLLRVQDKNVAQRLRDLLRAPADPDGDKKPAPIELRFSTNEGRDPQAREGKLVVDGKSHAVKRQDLPTIVESFKTYDDANLVKTGDIGQVIILPEEDKELPESIEAQNGLTPAMRNARKRRFRHPRLVDPKVIREVEEAILKISGGGAPLGYEFIDEEEEYVVSADGKSGSWQLKKSEAPAAAVAPAGPSKKPPAKRKPAKQKDSAATPEGSNVQGTEEI